MAPSLFLPPRLPAENRLKSFSSPAVVAAAACAVEGAQPAVSTGAWLTPQQLAALAATQADDWWLDWFIPAAVTGVVLLAAASVAGVFG